MTALPNGRVRVVKSEGDYSKKRITDCPTYTSTPVSHRPQTTPGRRTKRFVLLRSVEKDRTSQFTLSVSDSSLGAGTRPLEVRILRVKDMGVLYLILPWIRYPGTPCFLSYGHFEGCVTDRVFAGR